LDAAKQAEASLINSPKNPFREEYTRTKLANGLELFAGGYLKSEFLYPTNHYLSSAELYDPKTGRWEETGKMTIVRFDHGAVLLTNGNVLVVGGYDNNYHEQSSAEIYDPNTGKWKPTTSMHNARSSCKASLNPDGTVLIFMTPFNSPIEKCEKYDPATAMWTIVTNQPSNSR